MGKNKNDLNKRESCKGCIYRLRVGCGSGNSCCGYSLIEGELRGCEPEKCDKKVLRKEATESQMKKLERYSKNLK